MGEGLILFLSILGTLEISLPLAHITLSGFCIASIESNYLKGRGHSHCSAHLPVESFHLVCPRVCVHCFCTHPGTQAFDLDQSHFACKCREQEVHGRSHLSRGALPHDLLMLRCENPVPLPPGRTNSKAQFTVQWGQANSEFCLKSRPCLASSPSLF